jgi:cytochrome d oxidase subunit CydB
MWHSLVPIWTVILGLGVFIYVSLDGFDLGVGMLHGLVQPAQRETVMNSIGPFWDGNETWLILGGVGLLAAFPVAFAIIIPAVYFPILIMLLALVFRGVAFEFRFKHARLRRMWDWAFCGGSLVATFAQGVVLGSFIQGFKVQGRVFAGSSFDFATPFALLTGVALVFGYALLGAGWLVMKTDGALQAWSRFPAASWRSASGHRWPAARSRIAGSAGRTRCCWRRCRWRVRRSRCMRGARWDATATGTPSPPRSRCSRCRSWAWRSACGR